jgi:hypothetical protein
MGNFLGRFLGISIVSHQFSLGKIPSYICMEILLGTNAECTVHEIIPTFFLEFFVWKKIKFLRKDFDPSYLRIG